MSKAWKRIELEVCRIFGGERSGPLGIRGPDCKNTGKWAIQVKHRTVPAWLTNAMAQATGDTRQSDRIATLVLHPRDMAVEDSLVIFLLSDFRREFL